MIEILAAIFGGLSLIGGGAGLWGQFRKVNSFKVLRDGLRDIRESKAKEAITKEDDLLVECLAQGTLILGPLKSRLAWRFFAFTTVIIGLFLLVVQDMSRQEVAGVRGLDYFDLFVFAVQIAAAFSRPTSWFLRNEERSFLENLSVIHRLFYEKYVLKALGEFNSKVQKLPGLDAARTRASKEEDSMRRIAEDVFEKKYGSQRLGSDPAGRGTS